MLCFRWNRQPCKLNELEEGRKKVVRIRDTMIHFQIGAKSVLVGVDRVASMGLEPFWLWESRGGVTESRIDHRWANEEATKAFAPLHPFFVSHLFFIQAPNHLCPHSHSTRWCFITLLAHGWHNPLSQVSNTRYFKRRKVCRCSWMDFLF